MTEDKDDTFEEWSRLGDNLHEARLTLAHATITDKFVREHEPSESLMKGTQYLCTSHYYAEMEYYEKEYHKAYREYVDFMQKRGLEEAPTQGKA